MLQLLLQRSSSGNVDRLAVWAGVGLIACFVVDAVCRREGKVVGNSHGIGAIAGLLGSIVDRQTISTLDGTEICLSRSIVCDT